MGFFSAFRKKKPSLLNDIDIAADWIIDALNSSGYKVSYSIDSFRELDRFFNEHSENGGPKPGGLLSEKIGQRLFAIGSLVGEAIRRARNGVWITDDNDPNGETNIAVKFNDTILLPVQRVMKRFKNGEEDSLYAYGKAILE